ncbi:hypothetical protein GGI01_003475 [Coemansia sp. RSA 376]|nr:hypothetical protein GGI01_003475 [Coemansia sp. RSA 376]
MARHRKRQRKWSTIRQERRRLEVREGQLSSQRASLTTPEEIQQWQQQWDEMIADKEALPTRQQKHQEHLQNCEAKRMRRQQEHEKEEARWRQEKERRELLKLQRRPTTMERRRVMQELALSRNKPLAPSPNSILQLVFDHLSPVPGPACTPTKLTAHLLILQRVAAINREWRAVALPLFYRTVHVVIGHPLDPRDMDDSDNEVSGYNRGQVKGDTVDGGDGWDSGDDEEWLNAIGLSRSGVNIRLRTNIGLFTSAGLVDKASEVQIIVQGMGQTAGQLLRQLLLAELGRHTWPAVERLRIDMCDSSNTTLTDTMAEQSPNALKALNRLLSDILPSLREIEYYGPHSNAIYGCVLVEQLIKEQLQRPESLRVLRVKADCWPKLTDDYETGITLPPIYIERIEIDGPDESYLMPVPTVVADTLVELKLTPVVDGYEWKLFEYLGDVDSTGKGSVFSKLPLIFSSLKSLVLDFEGFEDFEPGGAELINVWRRVYPYAGPLYYSDDSDEEMGFLEDEVQKQLSRRFKELPDYDTVVFPVLTSLELRNYQSQSYLRMLANSPISLLVLSSQHFECPKDWSLSQYRSLRRLSIIMPPGLDEFDSNNFIKALPTVLSTVHSELQHLALVVNIRKDLELLFIEPSFADHLVSLTLEGEYGQRDVEHLLKLFPNLQTLDICIIVSEPIFTVPDLIDKYHWANTVQTLTPLNTSLRVLNAYGQRYFSSRSGVDLIPESRRLMAPELNHYRSLLIDFVCCLPALDMLRVSFQSVEGVNEGICAIVGTNVGLEHIGHLRDLRVRALDL